MHSLEILFGVQNHVSMAQECARSVLIFLFGFLLLRISGRRTFAKWSSLDVVVSIVAGSTLSRALTGNAPLWGTLAAMAVMVALHWIFAQAAARNEGLARAIEGASTVLAENGRLNETVRLKHGISHSDLDEALHSKGLDKVSQDHLVILDPNGNINIVQG